MRNFLVKVSKNFLRRSAQNSWLAYSPCIYSGLLWLKMFVCGNLWFYRVKKKFFKKTRFWGKGGLFWYKRGFCGSKGGIRVQTGLIGFKVVFSGIFGLKRGKAGKRDFCEFTAQLLECTSLIAVDFILRYRYKHNERYAYATKNHTPSS